MWFQSNIIVHLFIIISYLCCNCCVVCSASASASASAKYKQKSGFYASRVPPGRFEYPIHNGWMLTQEAVKICENDLACGGFTFRGAFKPKKILVEVYFFHVIQDQDPEPGQKKKFYNWSTYRVKSRNFLLLRAKIVTSTNMSSTAQECLTGSETNKCSDVPDVLSCDPEQIRQVLKKVSPEIVAISFKHKKSQKSSSSGGQDKTTCHKHEHCSSDNAERQTLEISLTFLYNIISFAKKLI
jgi:hypothetical protein